MELSQPGIAADSWNRVSSLISCHSDPYAAATNGKLSIENIFMLMYFILNIKYITLMKKCVGWKGFYPI